MFICYKFLADSRAKLLDLFPYVTKESVTGPTPQEHNREHRHSSEVHGHCCATSSRVKPNLIGCKTEIVGADGCGCQTETFHELGPGEMGVLAVCQKKFVDWCVGCGGWVTYQAFYYFCPYLDRAEDSILGTMVCYYIVFCVPFLYFKSYRYCVSRVQIVGGMI
jgi:hypothetical protein